MVSNTGVPTPNVVTDGFVPLLVARTFHRVLDHGAFGLAEYDGLEDIMTRQAEAEDRLCNLVRASFTGSMLFLFYQGILARSLYVQRNFELESFILKGIPS